MKFFNSQNKYLLFLLLIGAALLFVLIAVFFGPSQAQSQLNHQSFNYLPGQLIVKFKPSSKVAIQSENQTNKDSLNQLFVRYKVQKIEKVFQKNNQISYSPLDEIYKVELAKEIDLETALKEYQNDPNIEWAEPNYLVKLAATLPNDPGYSLQWALAKIKAPEAWDLEKGSSQVVVAVIDTGIKYDHPDLASNIWTNAAGYHGYDFVNADNDPMDDQGHGTHVAGIIGAVTNNNQGVAGTSWYCKLMALKAFDSNGYGTDSTVANSLHYAADNGAKIINMSFGQTTDSSLLHEAIEYAWDKGCLLVAAAGNLGGDFPSSPYTCYPAAYNPGSGYDADVLAVAGTNASDQKYGGANSGSNYGSWVDVSAPAENIYSTLFNNNYGYKSGTSMATPFVAGQAALLKAHFPSWSNVEILNQIRNSTDNIGYFANPGDLGTGRINLNQSLAAGVVVSQSLTISPQPMYLGSPTSASFTVHNYTPNPITYKALGVAVRLNEPAWNPRDFDYDLNVTIPAGGDYLFQKSKNFNELGSYRMWVAALTTSGYWIALEAKTGESSQIITTLNWPDLRVSSSLTRSPNETLGLGQEATFNFAIKNYSPVPITLNALGVATRLNEPAWNPRDFGYLPNISLEPGQIYNYSFTTYFTELGNYRSFVTSLIQGYWFNLPADSGQNNQLYFGVTFPNVKLSSNLTIMPQYLAVGQQTTVNFSLTNYSQSPVHFKAVGVAVRLNEPAWNPRDFGYAPQVIDSGATFNFSQQVAFSEFGSYRAWPATLVGNTWYNVIPEPGKQSTVYFWVERMPNLRVSVSLTRNPNLAAYSLGSRVAFDYTVTNYESTPVVLRALGIAMRLNEPAWNPRDFGYLPIEIGSHQSYSPPDPGLTYDFSEMGSYRAWVAALVGNYWLNLSADPGQNNEARFEVNKYPEIRVSESLIANPTPEYGQPTTISFKIHNYSSETIVLKALGVGARLNEPAWNPRDFGYRMVILNPEDHDPNNPSDDYFFTESHIFSEITYWRLFVASFVGDRWYNLPPDSGKVSEIRFAINNILVGLAETLLPKVTTESGGFKIYRVNGAIENYSAGQIGTLWNFGDWAMADLGILKVVEPNLSFNRYRGILRYLYSSQKGQAWLVNDVGIEDYCKGSYEEPDSWMSGASPESAANAWKAHAIAYRTYGLRKKLYPVADIFYLYSTGASQAYGGYSSEVTHPNLVNAVEATRGQVMRYNGEIILAAYHGRCGGATEDYPNQTNYPYLKSVSDAGAHYDGDYTPSASHHYGMCMVGCKTRALWGLGYDQILKYYYTGISIDKIY